MREAPSTRILQPSWRVLKGGNNILRGCLRVINGCIIFLGALGVCLLFVYILIAATAYWLFPRNGQDMTYILGTCLIFGFIIAAETLRFLQLRNRRKGVRKAHCNDFSDLDTSDQE